MLQKEYMTIHKKIYQLERLQIQTRKTEIDNWESSITWAPRRLQVGRQHEPGLKVSKRNWDNPSSSRCLNFQIARFLFLWPKLDIEEKQLQWLLYIENQWYEWHDLLLHANIAQITPGISYLNHKLLSLTCISREIKIKNTNSTLYYIIIEKKKE